MTRAEIITELKGILAGNSWRIEDNLKLFVAKLEALPKEEKQRTPRQSDSLHLWFDLVAKALNAGGWSIQKLLREKPTMEIDWNKDHFKELIWRRAQIFVLGKESTKELKKQEDIDRVFDHVIRYLHDPKKPVLDEVIPFPSETNLGHKNDAIAMATQVDYPINNLEDIL